MNNFDRAEKACYDRLRAANKNLKTDREIELEKELAGGLEREKIHLNRALRAEKKLEIAIKALREADILNNSLQEDVCEDMDIYTERYGYSEISKAFKKQEKILDKALKALKEIKE